MVHDWFSWSEVRLSEDDTTNDVQNIMTYGEKLIKNANPFMKNVQKVHEERLKLREERFLKQWNKI